MWIPWPITSAPASGCNRDEATSVRVSERDLQFFRRDLSKDERDWLDPEPAGRKGFRKDCLSPGAPSRRPPPCGTWRGSRAARPMAAPTRWHHGCWASRGVTSGWSRCAASVSTT